jgi:nucleotide-binding universal stress UspA family protein
MSMSAMTRALFAIDLSSNYRPLGLTTRKMFDHRSTEIVMLHAIEEPSRSARGMETARAMAQMEFLGRREFKFAQVNPRVEHGRAADCILDYVRTHDVDVIVMPAGDREGLGRGSLGHITEEILMAAPCAVWAERTQGSAETVRHICCAVKFDGCDEAVLSRAAEVAGDLRAELTIVHAVVPESPMALWWDPDAMEQEVRIARLRMEELRERFAPAARLHVEAGRLEWVVNRKRCCPDAGLLVASGRGTAAVAEAVACPVWRVAAPMAKPISKAAGAGQSGDGASFAAIA